MPNVKGREVARVHRHAVCRRLPNELVYASIIKTQSRVTLVFLFFGHLSQDDWRVYRSYTVQSWHIILVGRGYGSAKLLHFARHLLLI